MRKLASLCLLCFVLLLGLGVMARAQTVDPVVRVSAKDQQFRAEMGKALATFQDVLGIQAADISLWASAGATLDADGKAVGSFAALVPFKLASNLDASFGPEYRAIQGGKPDWDFVGQFALTKSQAAALSYNIGLKRFGLIYSRRL